MSAVGLCSALAALISSFTDKGDDEFGCTSTTGKTKDGGVPFTNIMCSREVATCSFMGPLFDQAGKIPKVNRWAISIACNEAIVVKWLQLVLMFIAALVIAMFAAQAGVRRKTRSPASKGL
ncbi:hypothetical protein P171DRAFT_434186 [Karstenula rhodostoma CBS 690.94]|uniref:Tetraspanin n=1 Tax=Karstenula rhodostoma CBS 690.94 TaxID=1392251 RepID=A0A9P4PCK2_9PLEO|nr:hypothetical protein P171DRAFT_434186 [Karstenula rhodostoma CBS 690.94]